MNEGVALGEQIASMATTMTDRVAAYLPSMLAAAFLLLVGWLLARLLRALTRRLPSWLDGMLARLLGRQAAERAHLERSGRLIGALVFWAVLLLFVTAAANVLGLQTFADWLVGVLDYLPTLVAGLLIAGAGYLVARFVADLIRGSGGTELGARQRQVLAHAAQVTILVGALLVGADQIGIKVTFLAIFAGATALAIAGGVVVAVSLGARTHVANLIGGRQLRQSYEPGQHIRVAGYEGRILELTPQAVVLEVDEGRVTLPARLFSEQPVVLMVGPPGRGSADG